MGVRGHVDYFRGLAASPSTSPRPTGRGLGLLRGALAFQRARDAHTVAGPFDRAALFRATVADFLAAVRHGTPPRTTADDGVAVLRIVDAARR